MNLYVRYSDSPVNKRRVWKYRPATTADLVAALREEGVGEVVALELDEFDGGYGFADENGITVMPDEGRYLVVRIDGETP